MKANQWHTAIDSKFKRRRVPPRFDSFGTNRGFQAFGENRVRKNRFRPIKKPVFGVQLCRGLSPISRQLFRSRFCCCACIFPSRKNAVNLLSISATQHLQERLRGAYRVLRPDRPVLALGSAQTSHLEGEIKIPTGIILLKFAVCAPPLPSFTKRYFPPPDCGRSDWLGRGGIG